MTVHRFLPLLPKPTGCARWERKAEGGVFLSTLPTGRSRWAWGGNHNAAGETLRQGRSLAVNTIFRDASTLPYSSSVSYFTVMVNVSLLPASFRSFGTRHEYPQVPSQPKGIVPSATVLPAESVIVTTGSSERRRSTVPSSPLP